MRTAFLTGCGSGFGHALARTLLERGDRVIATDEALGEWIEALPRSDRLVPLKLDVRCDDDVRQAVAAARALGEVDLVVNNAGIALFAPQEEGAIESFRDLLDVNVLGPARIAKALLPDLRKTRGTLVQLSSVAGRTVFPESGFYAATKYALEAMTEALFQEVAPFGVRVRLVEPGSFATRFLERAAEQSPPLAAGSPYAPLQDVWRARKQEVLEPPQDAAHVVQAILASLSDPAPFARVVVGSDAERILAVRDALGPDVWSRFSADRNGLVAPPGIGDVPSPKALMAMSPADPRFQLALLCLQHGHLGHWLDAPMGQEALARLRAASGPAK